MLYSHVSLHPLVYGTHVLDLSYHFSFLVKNTKYNIRYKSFPTLTSGAITPITPLRYPPPLKNKLLEKFKRKVPLKNLPLRQEVKGPALRHSNHRCVYIHILRQPV